MTDPELFALLEAVRADIEAAEAELRAATANRAPERIDPRAGAYRTPGAEEPDSVRERSRRAACAVDRLVELRRDEATVLVALEEKAGKRRPVEDPLAARPFDRKRKSWTLAMSLAVVLGTVLTLFQR